MTAAATSSANGSLFRIRLPGIAPLLIVIKLEQYDYAGAAAIGLAMLVISFGALVAINAVQIYLARRGRT